MGVEAYVCPIKRGMTRFYHPEQPDYLHWQSVRQEWSDRKAYFEAQTQAGDRVNISI